MAESETTPATQKRRFTRLQNGFVFNSLSPCLLLWCRRYAVGRTKLLQICRKKFVLAADKDGYISDQSSLRTTDW